MNIPGTDDLYDASECLLSVQRGVFEMGTGGGGCSSWVGSFMLMILTGKFYCSGARRTE